MEKYGFYIFQSMLEINEIWYIITIYNILSAQISSSPRAGRETFTNPNFPLRPPGPQIAQLRSEMSCDLSKKNRGAQKHTVGLADERSCSQVYQAPRVNSLAGHEPTVCRYFSVLYN